MCNVKLADPNPSNRCHRDVCAQPVPSAFALDTCRTVTGDTAFAAWATTATAIGINEVITAAHSPWQNAYAERLIGSIRRECLDHVIVANERGLRRVSVANSQSCRTEPERTRDWWFIPAQIRIVARLQSGTRTSPAFNRSSSRGVRALARANVAHGSWRNRRLIQPTTVDPPAIPTNTRSCAVLARARFRCHPAQPRMRAMTVKIALEIKQLPLQISGCPEHRPVETFAANRSDQAFKEWMRQRRVRHRLDGFHVEDSQIRLPPMESVQRIMVRAEVSRRRLATNRSIEHLAQRDAINDAAVHAEAHDAPRTFFHHDEHPVRV